jgi:hypothetical protein
MKILAIDPGSDKSAYVKYSGASKALVGHGIVPNAEMYGVINGTQADALVVEMVACMGMSVGATMFETAVWIGRFEREAQRRGLPIHRVKRHEEKHYICHNSRAKDANIRQALIDMFPATGGGKIPQVGTKSQPGPLYGVSKDVWAALAVAITYELRRKDGMR